MNSSSDILVKRLSHADGLLLPQRMSEYSSGCDIAAAVVSGVVLEPGDRALIPTGFCLQIPIGYEVQIRPRSGLAIKHGITVLNSPGTIDSDYRGEVKVILINLGKESFTVKRGDRIAQAVPVKISDINFIESDSINETSRGSGGFGHTGI